MHRLMLEEETLGTNSFAGEMRTCPVLSPEASSSPSFNCYSNSSLADIAARVVEEFRADKETDSEFLDDFFCDLEDHRLDPEDHEEDRDEPDEGDFEFAFVPGAGDAGFSLISADQIFYNGQIRPVYPIFNQNLLSGDMKLSNGTSKSSPVRLPLRKLLENERDNLSSEDDELDGIPAGTYCVWRPKEEALLDRCAKSNSTGASKRWRIRDLLHRSHSDGKEKFVFLALSFKKGDYKNKGDKQVVTESPPHAGKPVGVTKCIKQRK
ncbi:unnamed protein product [Cuscuta epithymum]|uniref:Uncharacterized protein n=1 Tax=Cuscuta epithymum TaxID=186058 RepID=A0AAV0FXH5_9ASTE|nr:unnamed protein product [Cuscuta epithymum]